MLAKRALRFPCLLSTSHRPLRQTMRSVGSTRFVEHVKTFRRRVTTFN